MSRLTIELPSQPAQREFNFRRWAELLADPELIRMKTVVEMIRR